MAASAFDIYLQPHPDDVCFSLGAFVRARRCGVLLTVFPGSAHMPNPADAAAPAAPLGSGPPSPEWITASRMNEDRAFAAACALRAEFLDLPGASLLGHAPFDLDWVVANRRRTVSPLLGALLLAAQEQPRHVRPWLFCPGGIGGHVDHVAVRGAIIENFNLLSLYYRIGFYEDLYYASDPAVRDAGVAELRKAMPFGTPHRFVLPFDEAVIDKMALVGIYRSQFATPPRSLEMFVPADEAARGPHEAFWSLETPASDLRADAAPAPAGR